MESRRFTGWHAFFIISGGFAIVFAVNALLAVMAIRTNPAIVVDDSYATSQHYNDGLAAGRAQKALGWQLTTRRDGQDLRLQVVDAIGAPLGNLSGRVTITHPLGAEPGQELALRNLGGGDYVTTLPPGRWIAEFRLQRGSQHYYLKKQFDWSD